MRAWEDGLIKFIYVSSLVETIKMWKDISRCPVSRITMGPIYTPTHTHTYINKQIHLVFLV